MFYESGTLIDAKLIIYAFRKKYIKFKKMISFKYNYDFHLKRVQPTQQLV